MVLEIEAAGRQAAELVCVAVRAELADGGHARTFGRLPGKSEAQPIGFGAEAAPEDERVEPEPAQDLRHLRHVPERVGHVADGHRARAEPLAHRPAEQQVAHERFGAGQELVGQHVARTDFEPASGDQAAEPGLQVRAQLDDVLEEDRLAVERQFDPAGGPGEQPDRELALVAQAEGWQVMRFETLGRRLKLAAAITAGFGVSRLPE